MFNFQFGKRLRNRKNRIRILILHNIFQLKKSLKLKKVSKIIGETSQLERKDYKVAKTV